MTRHSNKSEIQAAIQARHQNIFAFLGAHEVGGGKQVVRTIQPYAAVVDVIVNGQRYETQKLHEDGYYEAVTPTGLYEIDITDHEGLTQRIVDPYSFGLLLGEQDVYFFREGSHQRLWEMLGARMKTVDGVEGCQFAVWAPNAQRVSVVGDSQRPSTCRRNQSTPGWISSPAKGASLSVTAASTGKSRPGRMSTRAGTWSTSSSLASVKPP